MTSHYDRGVELYIAHQYQRAVDAFRQELIVNPDSAFAHAYLALTLSLTGNKKAAHQEALEAVSISPDLAFAHFCLSVTFADSRDYASAEQSIMQAIKLSPSVSTFYSRAARISLYLKKYWQALEMTDQSLALDAEDHWALIWRGATLIEMNQLTEADEVLDRALKLTPESSEAHLYKGAVKLEQNDKASSFEHYREALRLDPTSEAALVGALKSLRSKNPLYQIGRKVNKLLEKCTTAIIVLVVLSTYFLHLGLVLFLVVVGGAFLFHLNVFLLRFDEQAKLLYTKEEWRKNTLNLCGASAIFLALIFVVCSPSLIL